MLPGIRNNDAEGDQESSGDQFSPDIKAPVGKSSSLVGFPFLDFFIKV